MLRHFLSSSPHKIRTSPAYWLINLKMAIEPQINDHGRR